LGKSAEVEQIYMKWRIILMNENKPLDFLHQVFQRFLISGFIFYLFTIWLPFILFRLDTTKIVSNPVFIISVSIIIGLLLDLSRFYRFSWRMIGINKGDLDKGIVENFNIDIIVLPTHM
jgi:hypothetical protein